MRALGDSRRPLYYLIICCILNIILDLVAVVGLGMGIAGRGHRHGDLPGRQRRPGLPGADEVLRYAALKAARHTDPSGPSAVRIPHRPCPAGSSPAPTASPISSYRPPSTTLEQIRRRPGRLSERWTPFSGPSPDLLGITIATFAGQNYGARKYDRIQRSVRVCLGMSLGLCGGLLVFLFTCCRPLYYAFTTDPNVVDIGVYMLRTIAPAM